MHSLFSAVVISRSTGRKVFHRMQPPETRAAIPKAGFLVAQSSFVLALSALPFGVETLSAIFAT